MTTLKQFTQGIPSLRQPSHRGALLSRYREVRRITESLAEPLATEDYCIQSMTDVSPTKWHLAHTSWFYERFILDHFIGGYQPVDPQYNYLFNSYYNTVGPQHCRASRGVLSRPTVQQVYDYRRKIDSRMAELISDLDDDELDHLQSLLTIGLNHEQQHQELITTDFKHVLSSNPMLAAYHRSQQAKARTAEHATPQAEPTDWFKIEPGVYSIGFEGDGFHFDNEGPRHKTYLNGCQLATRLVTNREYLAFIEDGGYDRHEFWLSMGWATVNQQHWRHPIYWYPDEQDQWMQYTLAGPQALPLDEPVCHLSYFEADAYARWAGARLPTEQEWEVASAELDEQGDFQDLARLHLSIAGPQSPGIPSQMFGTLWQWTQSAYSPYPGYAPQAGALGEYNGKFMCNQYVLRGGSCATPADHFRKTYRNFFPPEARWQFAGIRLAKDST